MDQVRPKLLKGKASEKLLVSQRGIGMGGEDISTHIKRRYRGGYYPRIVIRQARSSTAAGCTGVKGSY